MDSHQTETVDPDEPVVDLAILAPGTLVASRYEIERLLGTGGFARVYAAYDRELGQRIAIKILRSERMNPASLTRLRREVTLARELARPTLVRVYDLGQDGDYTFLTMELVEGETLRATLQRGALPVEEIVRLAEPVLDALGALHEAGVVHRDVKPANILLTPDGGVKLGDFGLARRWDSGEKVTRTEALVGTLEYVAPEQALGKQVDGRADLYAFGVLLFEMLTTKLPLEAATNLGTVMAHIISTAPDVRTIRKDVPAWLAELIQKLMEKEPSARPQSAATVLEIIRSRRRDLGWRWRRSRARVAVYSLLVLVLAGFSYWRWLEYWRAFDHLETGASRGLEAIDRKGRTLWRDPLLAPDVSAQVVRLDERTTVVAGIRGAAYQLLPPSERFRLSILDASTGETLKEFMLMHAEDAFPLDRTFYPSVVTAVDPDHDGRQDLVITFTHSPYWPSFSVYVDPRTAESAPVLVASGHHRLAGLADLDGDGVDELLFSGPNNRLGWFLGVAAVKLVRPLRRLGATAWDGASTPDAEYTQTSERTLLWYALQPRRSDYASRLTRADPAKRLLEFQLGDGTAMHLTYDGFSPASKSSLEVPARQKARQEAYDDLRESQRRASLGTFDVALGLLAHGRAAAQSAAEPALSEWVAMSEAKLLVEAGRLHDAEERFRSLLKSSDDPSEVCWQAGGAFEAAGDLDRAARFHRDGMTMMARGAFRGRSVSAQLEALVYVLAQRGRWDEARVDIARFRASYPEHEATARHLTAFVEWRRGASDMETIPVNPALPGIYNYWAFEIRWAKGVPDVSKFGDELDAFRKLTPDPAYLHESLAAEILARKGQLTEATAMAERALADTVAAAKLEPVARAHLGLVERRAARLERALRSTASRPR